MRTRGLAVGLLLLLTSCAGREDASQLSMALAKLMSQQSQQVNAYSAAVSTYIKQTNSRALENASSASEVAAQTSMLAGTLDLSGQGATTGNFKKHVAVGPAAILADPLLAPSTESDVAAKAATADVTVAVKALTSLAKGESSWDVATMYFGIAEDAYKKLGAERTSTTSP